MKYNFYRIIVFIGFVAWITETAYFGWNEKAVTVSEKILDQASWILIFWGMIGDIATNLKIEKVQNIHTKNVIIKGNPILNNK